MFTKSEIGSVSVKITTDVNQSIETERENQRHASSFLEYIIS